MRIAFVFNRKTDDSLEQAEFDTDETIAAIRDALASGGHEVIEAEMPSGGSLAGWIRQIVEIAPDVVFNTAEGWSGIGRESLGPTIFEQLGIPYVGSGPYGCFLTLDKFLTKQMAASRGVPIAEGHFVTRAEQLGAIAGEVAYPVFVKPNYEGSSKGITRRSLCRDAGELIAYGGECLGLFPQGILIERYVAGRDVAVPFIAGLGDGGVLEPIEYSFVGGTPGDDIYDYERKNVDEDAVEVRCPARVDAAVRARLVEQMKRVVEAAGVLDFARADFRVTPEGEVIFLEINALPSLQPGAGIFDAAALLGLDYERTILAILGAAVARLGLRARAAEAPIEAVSG